MRSPLKKYCFLRFNEPLRVAVSHRIKESGKTIKEVAEEVGVVRERVSKYINDIDKKSLTQYDLLKLCEYLNIEVDINIEMK